MPRRQLKMAGFRAVRSSAGGDLVNMLLSHKGQPADYLFLRRRGMAVIVLKIGDRIRAH
jgi:hypothetical protein